MHGTMRKPRDKAPSAVICGTLNNHLPGAEVRMKDFGHANGACRSAVPLPKNCQNIGRNTEGMPCRQWPHDVESAGWAAVIQWVIGSLPR